MSEQQQPIQQQLIQQQREWLALNTTYNTITPSTILVGEGSARERSKTVTSALRIWLMDRCHQNDFRFPFDHNVPQDERPPQSLEALIRDLMPTTIQRFIVEEICAHATSNPELLHYYRILDPIGNYVPSYEDFRVMFEFCIPRFADVDVTLVQLMGEDRSRHSLVEINICVALYMQIFIKKEFCKSPPPILKRFISRIQQFRGNALQYHHVPYHREEQQDIPIDERYIRNHIDLYEGVRAFMDIPENEEIIERFMEENHYHENHLVLYLRKKLHQLNGLLQY